eukprot:TRINITY_DN1018_c0_g3_i1.p1 TRINITY_DN1018_c0_g3~~TRINITY_DN1018_c0_g3_i1.p1  ORF type:complete len:179 (+),score=19.37 TRINITY_DN1018_c0_g3_i1:61-597(+)
MNRVNCAIFFLVFVSLCLSGVEGKKGGKSKKKNGGTSSSNNNNNNSTGDDTDAPKLSERDISLIWISSFLCVSLCATAIVTRIVEKRQSKREEQIREEHMQDTRQAANDHLIVDHSNEAHLLPKIVCEPVPELEPELLTPTRSPHHHPLVSRRGMGGHPRPTRVAPLHHKFRPSDLQT